MGNMVNKKDSEKNEMKQVTKQKRFWESVAALFKPKPKVVVVPIFGGTVCGPANNHWLASMGPDEYEYIPPRKVVSFEPACQKHDDCWGKDGCKKEGIKACDKKFLQNMKDLCGKKLQGAPRDACFDKANSYHNMVDMYGDYLVWRKAMPGDNC